MWRITRKEIAAHKLRFVLLSLAIILGVAFMSGTQVLTATINKSFDDLFANINRGTDAVVRAPAVMKSDFGPAQRSRIPDSVANLVRRAPGVEAAEGNVQLDYAQIVDKQHKAIGNPGQGAPSLGFGWDPNPRLNPFHLVAPSRPPSTSDEVVIDKHTADKAKFHIGDQVEIITPKPPKTYRVVGIAKFGTADSLLGASAALFTLPEAQRIADAPNQFDQVAAVAAQGVSQDQLKANIQATLAQQPDLTLEVVTGKELTKENQSDVHKAIGFFSKALLIFALVALLVGMFIIYNTFSIIVAQRKREMALLRAIGASRRQVLGAVIGESVVVGLVASAVGVAGGVLLASGLKAVLAAFGVDIPASGIVLPTSAIVTGMIAGTLITVISAVFPARQAAQVPPIAAMRDVAIERPPRRVLRLAMGGGLTILGIVVLFLGLFGGSGILFVGLGALLVLIGVFVLGPLFARAFSRAIGAPIAAIKGMTGKLARENAARNPKRTATTASALMIGVALVGFITIFAASAKASVSSAIDSTLKTDYVITGGQGSPTLSPALDREIASLPVIQAATPLRAGQAKLDGTTEQVEAADPGVASQLFDVKPIVGNFENLTANSLAISKKTADSKHWSVGTQVNAQFVKTGVKAVPLTVQMIYKERLLAGDYFMSLAGYQQYFRDQLDFVIFAKLRPGVTPAEGRAALEPVVAKYPNAQLKDNAQYKADQEAQVTQIVNLVYALLFLAVFIALIGIVITLLLSIYERTRELGLLRAVGTSRRQVRSIVRWESVIISLLGTLVGLVVGVFFGWSVVRALKDDGFDKFAIAPVQLVVVVIIAAILGVVAAIWPARRAAKLDVLRAIGQE